MTIELKPDQERILQEALRQGRFSSIEDAVEQAIQFISVDSELVQPGRRQRGKKSLVELFADSPFKGVDLNIDRAEDTGRPLDL